MNTCMDCGAEWGDTIFLWVTDEMWAKMGCKPTDFLCAHCTVDRLQSITTYAYATDRRFKTGVVGPARLAITTQELA
jgi:hypothetical protein